MNIKQLFQSRIYQAAFLILAGVILSIILLPAPTKNLFSTDGFLPHATCYLRNPQIIFLHVSSDSLIGLAYLAISGTLAYLVYKARRDIPFHWMFLAFGLFIVACGFTHFMAVWTVWQPVYWLSGWVKLITGVASVATAIALPPLVPRVFRMIRSVKISEERRRNLQAAHAELETVYRQVKELDKLKTQFFANVSHELRTPLTLILGPARNLAAAPNLNPEQQHDLEVVSRNANLLLKQVNDLLEVARMNAGKIEMHYREFDLAQLVRLTASNFETLARERRVQYSISTPDQLMVQADPEKIERVLLNLLANAAKFVPEEGAIQCTLELNDRQAVIQVQDNGPGIPPEMRETVFEPFQQADGSAGRRFGGTGLGLSIARDFVWLHHGTITASQAPGGGALFRVAIPVRAPEGTAVAPAEPASSAQSREIREQTVESLRSRKPHLPAPRAAEPSHLPLVLVVEDNPDMNRYVSGVLSTHWRVASAFDGREGLGQALRLKPDLILSDIMMPGITGDQLVRELRAHPELQDIPVIILSAKTDDEMRLELLQEGAQDYLVKPVMKEELEARVHNLLTLQQARNSLQEELQWKTANLGSLTQEMIQQKKRLERAILSQRGAEDELRRLNESLETRIQERTRELTAANTELEAFSYTVSHDLRAPLRAIQGFAAALTEDLGPGLSEQPRDYLERVLQAARQMDDLIQDLLAYSRLGRETIQLEPVELQPLLSAIERQLAPEIDRRNAQISRQIDAPSLQANPTLLQQSLTNLISNALKFVPPDRTPEIQIRAREINRTIRIEIEDNGIGIAPEHQERIFRAFERLHTADQFPGTGIGLAIVLKAVQRMGGQTGLHSTPGQGSLFWIELPKS